jgi:predicted Ser/Thr protein kinase
MASVSSLGRGSIIGKCEVLEPIGRGGMGAVFRCRHRTLQIDVALKIMSFSAATEEERNGLVQRFFREAHAAARIRHENVVSVLDVDTQDGLHYMVMELVDGSSVKKLLEGGPLDPREAARLTRDTARALAAAHALGIVHRDVKPENILLTKDRRVKISDFGIASVNQETESDEGPKLTQTGQVVGTPHYMSPEQVNGDAVDGRADIYSLGATFYHLLTGTFPYRGTSAFQVCMKHVMEALERPKSRHPGVPDPLDELCVQMMAKKPGDRPQSAEAVADALDTWLRSAATVEMRAYAEAATGAPVFLRAPIPAPAAGGGLSSSLVATPGGAAALAGPDGSGTSIVPAPALAAAADAHAPATGSTPVRVNTGAAQVVETGAHREAVSAEESASMTLAGPAGGPGVEGAAALGLEASPSAIASALLAVTPAPAHLSPPPAPLATTPPHLAKGGAAAPEKVAPSGWPSAPSGWPRAPGAGAEVGGDAAVGSGSGKTAEGVPALSAVMRVRGLAGAAPSAVASASAGAKPEGAEKTPTPAPGPVGGAKSSHGRKDAKEAKAGGGALRALFMVALLSGAVFIGYQDGLHERTLKPLFLKQGWGWPPAFLAKLGLGGGAQQGGGSVIGGSSGGSVGGTRLEASALARDHFQSGVSLQGAGDVKGALAAFQRVIDAGESDLSRGEVLVQAAYRAAVLYEGEGRFAEALRCCELLRQLPPGDDERSGQLPDSLRRVVEGQRARLLDRVPPPPSPLAPERFLVLREPADRAHAGDLDRDGRADVAAWGAEGGLLFLTRTAPPRGYIPQKRLDVGEERAVDAEGNVQRLAGVAVAADGARPLRASKEVFGDAGKLGAADPERVEGADLYGDGGLDLVLWTRGEAELKVRRRGSNRGFLPAVTVALGGKAIEVFRGSLDGRRDAVVAVVTPAPAPGAPARASIVLVAIDKAGAVEARPPILRGIEAKAPVASLADLDGDGLGDLVASDPGDPTGRSLVVLRGDGTGAFRPEGDPIVLSAAAARIAAAPVDEDGASGLLALLSTRPVATLAVYVRGQGGPARRCAAQYALGGPHAIEDPAALAVGDLDGDGRADVAVLGRERGLALLYGDGGGALRTLPRGQ